MSEGRSEMATRLLDAINRRDLEAIKAGVDADFEFHPLVSVWNRSYAGHEGIAAWQRDLDELWDEFTIEVDDLQERGDETLIVSGHWRGRARGSAASLGGPIAAVVRFSGGKPNRADVYLDEAQAIDAAGSG